MAFRPRYANNIKPWPFGHATRTTFNIQPWPFGHATRTTLAFRPRYANNLGLSATLREQPSTLNKPL
ncbi:MULTISPECIES: hypothetical protein [unclassified Moorena]|uniref:hypothetical protein n=1 Tax=unclassified Moorena TaxID=2683338 RepID=UPI0013C55890|nr:MULTISPECIES: hypothetical protein [unclassified Moorena]NEO18825.1 hypothetical protein [Moorena sp. SIO4A5]NEQ56817.1 hypothetical protein [Moorena sp. SIO4A1]